MGITVYSLLWVVQDFGHQPYVNPRKTEKAGRPSLAIRVSLPILKTLHRMDVRA